MLRSVRLILVVSYRFDRLYAQHMLMRYAMYICISVIADSLVAEADSFCLCFSLFNNKLTYDLVKFLYVKSVVSG